MNPSSERRRSTTLFLSYSRRDPDAARALRNGLIAHGHDTWIDESGIGKAIPWRPGFEHAIERCTAVVLLVSPDCAISEECAVEADRATDMGTRFIPIVARDTDPDWEELHTRLLGLAHDWERRDNHRRAVFGGRDFGAAELTRFEPEGLRIDGRTCGER